MIISFRYTYVRQAHIRSQGNQRLGYTHPGAQCGCFVKADLCVNPGTVSMLSVQKVEIQDHIVVCLQLNIEQKYNLTHFQTLSESQKNYKKDLLFALSDIKNSPIIPQLLDFANLIVKISVDEIQFKRKTSEALSKFKKVKYPSNLAQKHNQIVIILENGFDRKVFDVLQSILSQFFEFSNSDLKNPITNMQWEKGPLQSPVLDQEKQIRARRNYLGSMKLEKRRKSPQRSQSPLSTDQVEPFNSDTLPLPVQIQSLSTVPLFNDSENFNQQPEDKSERAPSRIPKIDAEVEKKPKKTQAEILTSQKLKQQLQLNSCFSQNDIEPFNKNELNKQKDQINLEQNQTQNKQKKGEMFRQKLKERKQMLQTQNQEQEQIEQKEIIQNNCQNSQNNQNQIIQNSLNNQNQEEICLLSPQQNNNQHVEYPIEEDIKEDDNNKIEEIQEQNLPQQKQPTKQQIVLSQHQKSPKQQKQVNIQSEQQQRLAKMKASSKLQIIETHNDSEMTMSLLSLGSINRDIHIIENESQQSQQNEEVEIQQNLYDLRERLIQKQKDLKQKHVSIPVQQPDLTSDPDLYKVQYDLQKSIQKIDKSTNKMNLSDLLDSKVSDICKVEIPAQIIEQQKDIKQLTNSQRAKPIKPKISRSHVSKSTVSQVEVQSVELTSVCVNKPEVFDGSCSIRDYVRNNIQSMNPILVDYIQSLRIRKQVLNELTYRKQSSTNDKIFQLKAQNYTKQTSLAKKRQQLMQSLSNLKCELQLLKQFRYEQQKSVMMKLLKTQIDSNNASDVK
ncbi:Hypothetical_protein [Hexamita inflata]|uniref:Hypothetical_protein n=1 Tax=Hexamita inflata TaxID=28002 RepID=A0ABP1GUM2_9EUKA